MPEIPNAAVEAAARVLYPTWDTWAAPGRALEMPRIRAALVAAEPLTAERRPVDVEWVLKELRERLSYAYAALLRMSNESLRSTEEQGRLDAKAQGVALALQYLREEIAINA